MKIRPSVILVGAIVLVMAALFIWSGKKQAGDTHRPLAESLAQPRSQQQAQTTSKKSAAVATNAPVKGADAPAMPPVAAKTKNEQMKEGLSALNDEEIVLYGRAVDQYGAPVANATVSGVVQINNGSRIGTDRLSTVTDGNGVFTISGYTGKSLGINIRKSGYALATSNTRFVYSHLWPEAERHIPDPKNPVIFKMWKLQGAEPLAAIEQHYKLSFTKDPIHFDLLAAAVVPDGGDLEVRVQRPKGVVSQQNPQPWSIDLRTVNGGLIETSPENSALTFYAPDVGYEASASFGNNNGPDLVDKMFFFRSRGGQVYGKLHLLFMINNLPDGFMSVTFGGIANTNGSRNWEATAPQ